VSSETVQPSSAGATPPSRRVGRTIVVGTLVTLFAILLPITTVTAWAHRTVLDTSTYVDTIKPIASDPAVLAVASREATDQIFAALDVTAAITQALPANAAVLAGPITNGAHDYVEQAVNSVLSSSSFQNLWIEANRFAHKQLVAVLRGNTDVLSLTGGAVVINLVPLLNRALERSKGFVARVVGHDVNLPTINGDEIPAQSCAKISAAIDRPLPATCGVITLFRARNLDTARRLVQAFDRSMLALLILTPVLAALALVVSRRRRRTLLQLAIAGTVGLVVVRRSLAWTQDGLVAGGKPENREAREAIVRHLLSGFYGLTFWLVLLGLLTVAIALATGPYAWAVRMRGAVGEAVRVLRVSVMGKERSADDDEAVAWASEHYQLLRYGGIAVAVILVAALDLNLITFLVIAAVLALFEFGVQRIHALPLPPRHAPV